MSHGCHDCGSPNSCECACPKCEKRFSRCVCKKSDLAGLAARESAATRVEPMPVKNGKPHIADLVIADITGRKEFGMKKYGTALQPHNGRDALADAYQEALDLCKYLRQAIYERDGK